MNLWNSRNAVYFENFPSHSAQVSTPMCSLDKHMKEDSKIKINRYKTDMHFVSHMRYNTCIFLLHMRFVKFKSSAGIRLGIMFGNRFRLSNLLPRKNKPRLLSIFQIFLNMLSFYDVFSYDKHNIFLSKYRIL